MMLDIFSKKNKSKKNSRIEKRPKLIIDVHEKNSLVFSSLSAECDLEIKKLEIGDYLIGNTVIERKTFSDFISSMISRRLLSQLKNMQEYESRILILEGKDFEDLERRESKLNPNSLRGMVLSISLEWKTPIIFTRDAEETAKYLVLLAKQKMKESSELALHSRKPESKKEQKQYIIESFPGIGPKTAQVLLKKFKTVKNIINAKPEDLETEIGKKAESLRIVEEDY